MKELIILGLIAFYISLFYALVTLYHPDELKITLTIMTIFVSALAKELFNKLIQLKFDYIKNVFKKKKKKKK